MEKLSIFLFGKKGLIAFCFDFIQHALHLLHAIVDDFTFDDFNTLWFDMKTADLADSIGERLFFALSQCIIIL